MTLLIRYRRLSVFCLGIVFLCNFSGCHFAQKIGITKTGAPKYQRLHIDYQLKSSNGLFALEDILNESSNTPVIQQVEATDDGPEFSHFPWSNANLQIQYPHPEGLKNRVRATLRLSQGGSQQFDSLRRETWSSKLNHRWESVSSAFSAEKKMLIHPQQISDTDDEIWVYDFSKSQLDLMLTDLAGSGFFSQQTRLNHSATLSVSIDKGSVSKAWSPEPRLDDIISLVYQEGWLKGFAKNETTPQTTKKILPVTFEE